MTRSSRRAAARTLAALAAVLLLVAGCGDDDDTDASDTTGTSETAATSELSITDAWARTSPAVATNGAAYLTVTNDGDLDDALIGASADPAVAATVELHETVAADNGMGGETSTTAAMGGDTATTAGGMGMMEMRPVDRIEVPAGGSAELKPGGYHIMLLDLTEPLVVGETLDLTLTFEEAGEQVVTVEIRDAAP